MRRSFAQFAHDPANGVYGDCLRACVASLLDMETEKVPHFLHDGCDGDEAWRRVNAYLAPRGLALLWLELPPGGSLGNIEAYHILAGLNGHGDPHVVIAHSMEPVHNPDVVTNDFMTPEVWLKPYPESGMYQVGFILSTSKRSSPFVQFALPTAEVAHGME